MAKWTIANLSDLSAPFLLIDAAMIVYSTGADCYAYTDAGKAEEDLENWRSRASDYGWCLDDPLGLLEGAKVVSVESVYHAMELGRADV